MAGRSSVWDGTQWVSMTGGSGEDAGGGEPDDNYLRLDGANNNLTPNNWLRTVDADALYLKLGGGTLSGILNMGGNRISYLADPTSNTDAISRSYADTRYLKLTGGTVTGATVFQQHITVSQINSNNPGGGSFAQAWTDNYWRFRFGGTSTPQGVTIANYDTVNITLNRGGNAEFNGIVTAEDVTTPGFETSAGTDGNRVLGNANLTAMCVRNIWQTSTTPSTASKGDIWMHG